MIRIESNWKVWREMRDDLANDLLKRGLIVKPDPCLIKKKWCDQWGFRLLNKTPHSVGLENIGMGMSYNFEYRQLDVWSNCSHKAGDSFSVSVLSDFELCLQQWQIRWEKELGINDGNLY